MLSYIILNYNDYETTTKCINKIKNYKCIDHIVIVDNCSTNDSIERLTQISNNNIEIIKTDKNGGYGYGNNYGINYVKKTYNSNYIVISNPDVFIEEYAVEKCINFMNNNKGCTIVTPLMRDRNKNICYNCVWRIPKYWEYLFFSLAILGKKINFNYPEAQFKKNNSFECGCVAGSWLMIRINDFENKKIYDENIFLYCEETVLGIKSSKLKLKTFILTDCDFLHLHSVSINKSIKSEVKQRKLMWKSRLYVLDNYYKSDIVKKIFSRLVYFIAILEFVIIKKLKEIKNESKIDNN